MRFKPLKQSDIDLGEILIYKPSLPIIEGTRPGGIYSATDKELEGLRVRPHDRSMGQNWMACTFITLPKELYEFSGRFWINAGQLIRPKEGTHIAFNACNVPGSMVK